MHDNICGVSHSFKCTYAWPCTLCTPAKMKHAATCNEANLNQTKPLLLLAIRGCCILERTACVQGGGGGLGECNSCVAGATKRKFVQCTEGACMSLHNSM